MEINFGDKLYNSISNGRGLLFTQGEMANLTYISYEKFIQLIETDENDIIPISHPVGFRADNTPINSTTEYSKVELIGRYNYLGLKKLPIDGILQLVTITETILNYILKEILIEFPSKIPNKRKMDVETALSANSLEEIKISIIETILNEIAYKSPKDYADEFQKYTGLNLLEFPPYHKYIELKATRDIHIHNGGTANEIYIAKAGMMARVKSGYYLPVDIQYFLQSYENCLQLTEILEKELDRIWPSNNYREDIKASLNKSIEEQKDENVEKVIEESIKNNSEE